MLVSLDARRVGGEPHFPQPCFWRRRRWRRRRRRRATTLGGTSQKRSRLPGGREKIDPMGGFSAVGGLSSLDQDGRGRMVHEIVPRPLLSAIFPSLSPMLPLLDQDESRHDALVSRCITGMIRERNLVHLQVWSKAMSQSLPDNAPAMDMPHRIAVSTHTISFVRVRWRSMSLLAAGSRLDTAFSEESRASGRSGCAKEATEGCLLLDRTRNFLVLHMHHAIRIFSR